MVMIYPLSVLLYSILPLLLLFTMPRRDDDDDIYDAFLDMREANEEYEYDEYNDHDGGEYDDYDEYDDDDEGECHEMSGEPYDVFIDVLDDEDGDVYERNYILRAREATKGVCQMVPCDLDELYWLRYQYCMLTDELEKYRASSYRMTTRDASSGEVLSAEPDIDSGSLVAVECAEWVLANE